MRVHWTICTYTLDFTNSNCICLIMIRSIISSSYINIIITENRVNISFCSDLDLIHQSSHFFLSTFLQFSSQTLLWSWLIYDPQAFLSGIEARFEGLHAYLRTVEDNLHQWQLEIPARSCKINLQTFIQIIIQELKKDCLDITRLESSKSSSALQLRSDIDPHNSWNWCMHVVDLS